MARHSAEGQGRLGGAGLWRGTAWPGSAEARQARLGAAWQGRQGAARPSSASLGKAWRGSVCWVAVRHGKARQAGQVTARSGSAGWGLAWQGGHGAAGRCGERCGMARHGTSSLGVVRQGKAGTVRPSWARLSTAWRGRARQARRGKAKRGRASFGKAGGVRPVAAARDAAGCG